ncbi:hypothetical protein, partial [Streptomyces sp. NPDC006324]|uniref:hypothetical protein n=1 Tax=Streptomyces sp. NPDC006324 TaxID=3156751 RepID=UPI0033A4CAD8
MADPLLFHPHTYDPAHFDPETRRLLRATVDWFEARGKRRRRRTTRLPPAPRRPPPRPAHHGHRPLPRPP